MARNPLDTEQTEDPRLDGEWPATVETGRAAALEAANQVERLATAKLAVRSAELARLTRKHGDTHPRVVEARARLVAADAQHSAWTNKLGEARAAAGVQVKEDVWCLHGFVRQDSGQPAPRVTIVIVDDKGTIVEELGDARTDERGYFRLERGVEDPGAGTRLATAATNVSAAAAATIPAANDRKQLFVRAVNAKKQPLQTDTAPVTPTPGSVDFRILVLPPNAET